MLKKLLETKLKLFKRSIFYGGKEHLSKLIVGVVVVGLFFVGILYFFLSIFNYLLSVEDIGLLMIDKIISLGFLAFTIFLIISNIITSISTLYRSQETHFLLSKPLKWKEVFYIKFIDNTFYSSWATLVIGFPLFLAYTLVHGIAWYYFLAIGLFVFLPFILIPAFIGTAISMFLYLLGKRFGLKRVALALSLISLVSIYAFFKFGLSSQILFNIQGDLRVLNYYLKNLGTASFAYLPNVWIMKALKASRHGALSNLIFYALCIISTVSAFFVLINSIVKKFYYKSTLAAVELGGEQKRSQKQSSLQGGALWRLLSVFPKRMRSTMVKDIKLFFRSPNQWPQFSILLVLLIVYLLNLRYVPTNVEELYWQTLITFANYAFCGYILATLAVRFVYPSISLEGKSVWSVLSSPLSIKELFWEKFWIAFLLFFVISEIIVVISNIMLGQTNLMILLTSGGILLMSISLTSISVGLGIIYPYFEEQNPGKIASSGGGMVCALISLLYVGASVFLLAIPTHRYTRYLILDQPFPQTAIILAGVGLIILNAAATIIPLKLGLKHAQEVEF